MNIYRKHRSIASILLLAIFLFAASHPVRNSSAYNTSKTSFQSHLEHLAISVIPDWQTATFHVKSPLIGTTWTDYLTDRISRSVQIADALNISVNEFSHVFAIPTINAP